MDSREPPLFSVAVFSASPHLILSCVVVHLCSALHSLHHSAFIFYLLIRLSYLACLPPVCFGFSLVLVHISLSHSLLLSHLSSSFFHTLFFLCVCLSMLSAYGLRNPFPLPCSSFPFHTAVRTYGCVLSLCLLSLIPSPLLPLSALPLSVFPPSFSPSPLLPPPSL